MWRRNSFGMVTAMVLAAAALVGSVVSRGALEARQGGGRQMVPVAASSLVLNPDAYIGQLVTMTGAVEQMLSRTAFSVDQDRTAASGREVLVLAPTLTAPVPPNTYVTVIGEVVRFDPDEVARRARGYTLDLAPDVVAKFRGTAAVIATGVITPELTDLARRPPPPLTAAETAFDKVMKTVNPTFAALRKAIDGTSADMARENTAVLKRAFGDVQLFFRDRGAQDAVGWAGEAVKFVEAIERAAAAGRWEDASTAAGSLNQLCQQCHATHRERLEDGTFRVRGSR